MLAKAEGGLAEALGGPPDEQEAPEGSQSPTTQRDNQRTVSINTAGYANSKN